MFGKNLVLELWSKNLKANQNAGFFKLEYLTNKLKLDFWMWLEVHESNKCYLDMPNVITNSESALS